MTGDELTKLFERIKNYYPQFEFSKMKADAWIEHFKNIPLDVAMSNLRKYVERDETGRQPTIAHLVKGAKTDAGVTIDMKYREKHLRFLHPVDDYTFEDENGLLWAVPCEMDYSDREEDHQSKHSWEKVEEVAEQLSVPLPFN